MDSFVHGQFTSLPKFGITSGKLAFVWFVTGVNIDVVFEVLGESEHLAAILTLPVFLLLVPSLMSL